MKNKNLNYLSTKAYFILLAMVRYFGFKVKVDNKLVRRSMIRYFSYHDWCYAETITKIETTESKKGLEILIETHRPGLLIGKAGVFIDGMVTHLMEDLNRDDIKINLQECKLWTRLYK
jgi:ribosomal protein S3